MLSNNQLAVSFRDPPSQFTALLLMVNIGGVKTLKPVRVGSPDSAGTGFRQLFVQN